MEKNVKKSYAKIEGLFKFPEDRFLKYYRTYKMGGLTDTTKTMGLYEKEKRIPGRTF